MSLAKQVLNGDMKSAARLMRKADDRVADADQDLKELYPHTGKAYIIGITGSPGAGKSTLVDQMIAGFRKERKKVGVVVIDPTSPFSGGAILGDRIRMQRHGTDEGVFIKSLATRGRMGGLSNSARDIVRILDAMGKDIIIIETVGVGQDEVEIINFAHTTLVVTVPGMGDEVQSLKAGILEIADLFVINKADRNGASRACRELQTMLNLKQFPKNSWRPLIFKTEALKNKGVSELIAGISKHRDFLMRNDRAQMKKHLFKKLTLEFTEIMQKQLYDLINDRIEKIGGLDQIIKELIKKERDPYTVVEEIINREFKQTA